MDQSTHRAELLPQRPDKVGELFTDLARDLLLLIRQEIALAKAEVTRGVTALGLGVVLVAAGALVAFVGLGYLLLSAILALSLVIEPWLAALIVGGGVLVFGAGLAIFGKTKLKADAVVPRRTLRTLEDDAAWMKEQAQ
jgi:uncharacterized membrane protein YqgA involved in biofilm formation